MSDAVSSAADDTCNPPKQLPCSLGLRMGTGDQTLTETSPTQQTPAIDTSHAIIPPSTSSSDFSFPSNSFSSFLLLIDCSHLRMAQQDAWLRLGTLPFILRLSVLLIVYHIFIMGLSVYTFAALHQSSSSLLPPSMSPPASVIYFCLAFFLLSIPLTSPLCLIFVCLRWKCSDIVMRHMRKVKWTYGSVRVLTALLTVMGIVAVASIPSPAQVSAFACYFLLWIICGIECMALFLPLFMQMWAARLFSLSVLFPLPPFIPPLTEDQIDAVRAGASLSSTLQGESKSVKDCRQRTIEQLKAIPARIYSPGMKTRSGVTCDGHCVICCSDIEEGEEIRLFHCGHGFHRQCCDDWLATRRVCPLCLKYVVFRKPPVVQEVRVEMTGMGGEGK